MRGDKGKSVEEQRCHLAWASPVFRQVLGTPTSLPGVWLRWADSCLAPQPPCPSGTSCRATPDPQLQGPSGALGCDHIACQLLPAISPASFLPPQVFLQLCTQISSLESVSREPDLRQGEVQNLTIFCPSPMAPSHTHIPGESPTHLRSLDRRYITPKTNLF